MPELTIVAIPSKDDYVWKLSSEKVPHLTLMYLGQVGDRETEEIDSFVEHVADTTMCPFGLDVDYRGTLGPKDADVIFFKDYCTKVLKQVRSYFLTNEHIDRAYNTTEQFPEWVPHLTMGYPETPAHEDTREYPGVHWVNFDTLALWTGDYEGYEYRLDYPYEEMMYMDDHSTEALAHYGIKGMHWGIRRTRQQLHESADHKTAAEARAKAKKGGVKTLSNAELKTLVERMNLEQQYSRVVPPSKGARIARAGAKFTGEVLVGAGKHHATRIATDHLGRAIGGVIRK